MIVSDANGTNRAIVTFKHLTMIHGKILLKD